MTMYHRRYPRLFDGEIESVRHSKHRLIKSGPLLETERERRRMRKWVKPYILQRTAKYIDGLMPDRLEKEQWLALKSNVLEDPDILYYELTLCLNCHFGRELGDPQEFFYKVFGSVLADLPEEVFKKLCDMKNLLFTYNPNPEGEVKVFGLEHDITEDNLQAVTFPFCSGFVPPMALRGQIVHQLVKVCTGLGDVYGQEDRIDSIAIQWGFGEETKAAKQYKKETESRKKEHLSMSQRKPLPSKTLEAPCLIVSEKKGAQKRVFRLEERVTTIGRHPDNDIVLKDTYVSNHHAEIRKEDDSHFLHDCASTNGTRVNGQRIHRKRIVDADIIQIGRSTLTFLFQEALSSTKPDAS
jgi:pSer/pThr/pTyr-binding forkhead associated (FHA) protein